MHSRCCRPATSSVHCTTNCKRSLVLLKMGEIIARNMLSWLELLINRYCCIYLAVYIICINDVRSSKYRFVLFQRVKARCYVRNNSSVRLVLKFRYVHSTNLQTPRDPTHSQRHKPQINRSDTPTVHLNAVKSQVLVFHKYWHFEDPNVLGYKAVSLGAFFWDVSKYQKSFFFWVSLYREYEWTVILATSESFPPSCPRRPEFNE